MIAYDERSTFKINLLSGVIWVVLFIVSYLDVLLFQGKIRPYDDQMALPEKPLDEVDQPPSIDGNFLIMIIFK